MLHFQSTIFQSRCPTTTRKNVPASFEIYQQPLNVQSGCLGNRCVCTTAILPGDMRFDKVSDPSFAQKHYGWGSMHVPVTTAHPTVLYLWACVKSVLLPALLQMHLLTPVDLLRWPSVSCAGVPRQILSDQGPLHHQAAPTGAIPGMSLGRGTAIAGQPTAVGEQKKAERHSRVVSLHTEVCPPL